MKSKTWHIAAVLISAVMIASAHAQVRNIAENASLGTLQMGVFPQASIDGQDVRFGAGARILDQNNRIVVPASLSNQQRRVAYVQDFQGLIRTVWLVDETEADALIEKQRLLKSQGLSKTN